MLLTAGDLADHNIETARARHRNVIRSLSAPTDCKKRLWRRLKLRVDAQLAVFVFTPDEHFRVLDNNYRLRCFLLRRWYLWRLHALIVRRGNRLLGRGPRIVSHPVILKVFCRWWI